MNITIYCFPGSCSRVTMAALEEVGVDYRYECVNLRADEQKSDEYRAINPKGKVPVVAIDGQLMTENPAILWHLHKLFPEAGLLPSDDDRAKELQGLIDLIWCGGTLHPIVRQIRAPFKLTIGETDGIHADGVGKFLDEMIAVERRIGEGWWYGDKWSIVDTYLFWAYTTARIGGFPLERCPGLEGHEQRVRARRASKRVFEREAAMVEEKGLPGVVL